MFEFFFTLVRNGDPEFQLQFDHWPAPEEVAMTLRNHMAVTGHQFWNNVLETWAKCVLENGLPKQPEVGKFNCETWGATRIHVKRKL